MAIIRCAVASPAPRAQPSKRATCPTAAPGPTASMSKGDPWRPDPYRSAALPPLIRRPRRRPTSAIARCQDVHHEAHELVALLLRNALRRGRGRRQPAQGVLHRQVHPVTIHLLRTPWHDRRLARNRFFGQCSRIFDASERQVYPTPTNRPPHRPIDHPGTPPIRDAAAWRLEAGNRSKRNFGDMFTSPVLFHGSRLRASSSVGEYARCAPRSWCSADMMAWFTTLALRTCGGGL